MLAALALLASGPVLAAQPAPNGGSALRAGDYRVAALAFRLAVGGRALCPEPIPQSGIAFHHLADYPPGDRDIWLRAYPLDRGPGILAVVENSPAARAGIRAGDVLVAVDGAPLSSPTAIAAAEEVETRRAWTFDVRRRFEGKLADGAADLTLIRGGETRTARIEPEPGCPLRARIARSDEPNAFADGEQIVVTSRLVDSVGDDGELAVILAHELAHNVLRHAAALEEAGVPERGLARRLGSNRRALREAERAADRFAVELLDAAGFDPAAGLRLWQRLAEESRGPRWFSTHPRPRARLDQWRDAIEARRARAHPTEGE